MELGEHAGTHFDAPCHWISGRDGADLASVPPEHLVGPAVVIDKVAETEADPDYLLTVDRLKAWEAEHGALPENGWLFLRTGWDARADDQEAFLNAGSGSRARPAPTSTCARWLAEDSPLRGFGVETVGIDAGAAAASTRRSRSTTTCSAPASTASPSSPTCGSCRPPARWSWSPR